MSNRILFLASAAYSFAKQRQVYSDTRLMVTPFLSIKIYEVTLHFEKCYFNLLGCICNGFCLCPKDTLDLKSNAFDLCSQSFLFKRNGIITITPHCIHGRPPPSPPSIQALTNRPQLRLLCDVWSHLFHSCDTGVELLVAQPPANVDRRITGGGIAVQSQVLPLNRCGRTRQSHLCRLNCCTRRWEKHRDESVKRYHP